MSKQSVISDPTLATKGREVLSWTKTRMPILATLKKRLADSRPFEGLMIGICLHVEPKTAVWVETLVAGGAKIAITGSPGTTVDEIAAYLQEDENVSVFARRDETFEEHLEFCRLVLEQRPDLIADNGADLHMLYSGELREQRGTLIGATEETTSGGFRLREEIDPLEIPTVVINDSRAKRIIENRYGVGQSVVEAIMRSTRALVGGLKTAVIGYGYCGRGVALCFRALGARVSIVEIDPLKRLDALLEGFDVCDKAEALEKCELVVTVTGRDGTLAGADFEALKDGAILANAGHFEFEIDVDELTRSAQREFVDQNIESFRFGDGKKIFLLGKGRPVNLSAGDGNPIEVMDLGLALQTLSLKFLVENRGVLRNGPQNVPEQVEGEVSGMAFEAWK